MKYICFILLTVICITLYSCKKGDNTYRDYNNTLNVYNGTALQYLQSQPGQYDSLLLVLNRIPDLKDTLSKNPITLFAMSNRSFTLALKNINDARADSLPVMPAVSLSNIPTNILDTFLCRYILRGKYLSTDLLSSADGLEILAVKYGYRMFAQFIATNASGFVGGGPREIKFSDTKNSIFTMYWVSVNTITTDIQAANANINILPPGHDFGFGADFIRAVNRR